MPSRIASGLPIDASRHAALARLVDGFAELAAPGTETGELGLIVRRLAGGARDEPAEAELTVEQGLVGDSWHARPPRDPNAQITVMRRDVALLIANGHPLTLFGDNLFVDFDISTTNLPAGARLRVGQCVVEVTPKPHNGCRKFEARFGHDALRFTALKETLSERLSGVHWRVVEPGVVRVGAPIEVLSR